MTDPFHLTTDDVHVWTFNRLDMPENLMAQMHDWLPAEDQRQAERYKMPDDRIRFCIGRTMVRYLSGRYMGLDGQTLKLAQNDQSKPYWADAGQCLQFNLSHSGAWVVMAFTPALSVGIDVQERAIGPKFDALKLADHAYHPDEIAALTRAGEEDRIHLFHDIWVCKEAIIKATGLGLHEDLRRFSVLPLPEMQDWRKMEAMGNPLNVLKLDIDSQHTAALAVQTFSRPLKVNKWTIFDSGWPLAIS